MIHCQFPALALQQLSDGENFRITLQIKTDSNFFRIAIFLLCAKDDLNVSLSVMQGLPTLQNHLPQIDKCILPEYEKFKFDHLNPTRIKQFMLVEVSES